MAANWSPNQVPGGGDTASVTVSGAYTITLDQDAVIGGLLLGAPRGLQVLTNPASTLTLNGAGLVLTNGALSLGGGQMAGPGLLTVGGLFGWSGGSLAVATSVLANGYISIGGVGDVSLTGILTNAGSVTLADQSGLLLDGTTGGGQLFNFEAGQITAQGVTEIVGAGEPGELFSNAGTVRATGGILTIGAVGTGGGWFVADSGALIDFAGAFTMTDGGALTGAGTNLNSGTFAIQGTVISSNMVLSTGTFRGTNGVMQGSWVWSGGVFSGAVAVSTNSFLAIAFAGNTLEMQASLTNRGTISMAGEGELRLDGYLYGGGQLENAPGGRINSKGILSIKSLGYGPELFVNDGILDSQNGSLSLQAGGAGAGQFVAEAGAALIFPAGFTANNGSSLTGSGTNLLSGGSFVLNGNVALSNAVINGASLQGGVGYVNGSLNWVSGDVTATLSVLSNASLNITPPNGALLNFYGALTNLGTVRLQGNGTLLCNGNYFANGDIYNLPGGTIQSQGNFTLSGAGTGSELVANSGTIEAQTGGLFLGLGGTGAGQFVADAGAVLNLAANFALKSGSGLTGSGSTALQSGIISLEGGVTCSNAVLAGASIYATNAVLGGSWVWSSGTVHGNLTVASNSTLTLSMTNDSQLTLAAHLWNAGLVSIQGQGTLELDGSAGGGVFENLAGAVLSLAGSAFITAAGATNEVVLNHGIVSNNSGAETNHIAASFVNLGVVDSETGVLSFDGAYTQTNGIMQFGINASNSFGSVNFADPAPLEGTLAFNLNHGYAPDPGAEFVLITYPSFAGGFADTNEAFFFDWQIQAGGRQTAVTALGKVTGAVAPAIVQDPVGTNAMVGQPVTLSANVTGTAPIVYQWRLNGVHIRGAMDPTLVLGPVHPALAGVYSVDVRNAAGAATSVGAEVAVAGLVPVYMVPPILGQGSVAFSVATQLSVVYVLERKTSLTAPSWTVVQSAQGTGLPLLLTDLSAPPTAFYRIGIQ